MPEDPEDDDVTVARKRSALEMFRRIAAYARRYPWFAAGTMVSAILTTLFGLAYPKLTQLIVDNVIVQGRSALLLPYVLGLAAAFLLRDLFNGFRILLNNSFEQHVVFDMRRDLYNQLQRLHTGYFDQRASGDIMTRVVDDVTSVERVLIDGLEQGTTAILTIGGVLIMLCTYNVKLAFLSMIPIPLLALGAVLYTTTAHLRYRAQRRAASAMNSLLLDNLQGIRQIKAFAREKHELGRFEARANELRQGTLTVMRAWALYSPAMTFAASLGAIIVLYYGGLAVLAGKLTVGGLVGFLAYLVMFYEPVDRLHSLNQMFQQARAAGERVFDILDAPSEIKDRPNAHRFPSRVEGDLRFESVGFEYVNSLPVLHDITFRVEPGQTVALVGPTGAGKSTIINLLPRFYDASGGRILVDGHDVREVSLVSLREQIGIVSQEPFLFNGTIRENILYGRLDANEDEMIAATKAANAHDFIARLPEGYDSRVGERGVKLSVGEKQRVSIARALLKNPPILLLDEATASVDTGTERLIQEALERLMSSRTCVMIAHRLSTVRHADVILVLEHGRIVERGAHEELLEKNGLYARLCKIQSTATIEETLLQT